MTVTEAIQKAYLHALRKSDPPTSGNKYDALIIMADSFQKEWAHEPGVEWNSKYSLVDNGTVTATDTFTLDTTIDSVSKRADAPVRTVSGDQYIDYPLVGVSNREAGKVAQQGRNLVFTDAFTTDSQDFGWDIYVPSILYVSDITAGTDVIEVDDPMWLVFMMAAEFIRNDVVRQNQYSNLLNHANLLMTKMKESNMSQDTDLIIDFQPAGADWE